MAHGEGEGKKGKKNRVKDDWVERQPGCENAKSVQSTKASECCAGLPQVLSKEATSNCSSTCRKTARNGFSCCKADCFLAHYKITDEAGKFDAAKAKEVLKAAVNNDDKWVSMRMFV